jgi:hypothetical protein
MTALNVNPVVAAGTPRNLVAVALAVMAFVGNPLGGGVAQAKVWSGRPSHFAPPSGAGRLAGSPMRAHAAPEHAMLITPRRTPTGPFRAHNGMFTHFATLVSPRASLGGAMRAHPTTPARFAVTAPHDARLLRVSRGAGLRSTMGSHPALHPLASTTPVRWPVAAGPHPVSHGVASPPPRVAREAWIPPTIQRSAGR